MSHWSSLESMWYGYQINVVAMETLPPGINSPQDLEKVRKEYQ